MHLDTARGRERPGPAMSDFIQSAPVRSECGVNMRLPWGGRSSSRGFLEVTDEKTPAKLRQPGLDPLASVRVEKSQWVLLHRFH